MTMTSPCTARVALQLMEPVVTVTVTFGRRTSAGLAKSDSSNSPADAFVDPASTSANASFALDLVAWFQLPGGSRLES